MKIAEIVVELMGLVIFVVAFAPQASRMWTRHHSYGMAPSSWTMNFIGRYLWVIASLFFGNEHHMATIMLTGQGLVALLTIPIVYYAFRNIGTHGQYNKTLFNIRLFVGRMIALVLTLVTIVVCILLREGVVAGANMDDAHNTLGIGVFFVQIVPAVFTGIAFLPQTLRTLKTRKTKSISLITSLFFSIGNSLIILSIIIQVIDKGLSGNFPDSWWYSIGSAIFASLSVMLMFTVSFVKAQNILKGREKLD